MWYKSGGGGLAVQRGSTERAARELTLEDVLAIFRLEVRRFLRAGSGQIDVHDENDLVQWLIERLLGDEPEVLSRFDPVRGAARGYFGKFARRRLIDRWRRVLRRSELATEVLGEERSPGNETVVTPEAWMQYLETTDRLMRALEEQCSPEDLEIFRLAFIEDLSNGEVGERTNVPPKRIATRKHALRSRIREFFGLTKWKRRSEP